MSLPPLPRLAGATAAAAAGLLALAACGSGSTSTTVSTASSAPAAAANSAQSLKGTCPDTVVIQTDWNPEAEHGALYQLVGPNPTIDADKKRVTGPLVAHGGVDTGVKVEVRTGGPAIGFQTVSAQMYLDKAITLGYVSTDEAIQFSAKQPTTAVVATNEKSPQMIMWSPAAYPNVKTIADLGAGDVKTLYFQGATYMDYLVGAGILKKGQVDGSYDGSPGTFVGGGGKVAQQGFATAEPYIYENEIKQWKKPVSFQLIADTGFPIYPEAVSVRTGDKESLAPCLKKLVPILQQAQIDYVKSPATANTLIVDLVKQYKTGWVYSQGVADFSVQQQLKLGIVGNGPDTTLGNFDAARVQKVLDIVGPISEKAGKPAKAGLKAADLFTNDFIDPKIGLS